MVHWHNLFSIGQRFVFRHEYVTLLLVFLFAFFLRVINLPLRPEGFHMDEVANTYIGRYILTNGVDLYGQVLPLFYADKFQDFPPVIPMYLSGLASFFFGINEWSSRLPAAILGSAIVFPLYFLVRQYSKATAFIATCVVSVFPWHVILSRASSEGIIALTVSVVGFFFLIRGIRIKRPRDIAISWIFFSLTYLLYPSFRILVPLIFLPLPFLFRNASLRRVLVASIILFVILTGIISSTYWGRGRFHQTSLFLNPTDRAILEDNVKAFSDDDGDNFLTARLFHNKGVEYGRRLVVQYLSYYSPEFLYSNDNVPRRYNVSGSGIVPISFFVFIALFLLFRNIKIGSNYYKYLLYLLAIAPIPAAITVDDFPNMHRSLFMILPLTILFTLGIFSMGEVLRKRLWIVRYGVLFGFSVIFFVELIYSSHQYYAHAGSFERDSRNIGSREVAEYLVAHHAEYPEIIMSEFGWLPLYYLAAQENYDKSLSTRFGTNFTIPKIDNIEFVHEECPSDLIGRKEFLSTHPSLVDVYFVDLGICEVSVGYEEVYSVKKRDGTDAFRIIRIQP